MRWLIIGLGISSAFFALRRWAQMFQQQAYEQTQSEAALEKLRFLQRLDHELKNPLTAMQIALANLEDATDPKRREEGRSDDGWDY